MYISYININILYFFFSRRIIYSVAPLVTGHSVHARGFQKLYRSCCSSRANFKNSQILTLWNILPNTFQICCCCRSSEFSRCRSSPAGASPRGFARWRDYSARDWPRLDTASRVSSIPFFPNRTRRKWRPLDSRWRCSPQLPDCTPTSPRQTDDCNFTNLY